MRLNQWEVAMKPRYVVPLLTVMTLAASSTRAQVIFIDPCETPVPFGTSQTLDVWVCVEGTIIGGITAAEFRIAGLPASWATAVDPDPAGTATGDLFGNGVRIAFPNCNPGSGQYLHLFTVRVTALDSSTDVVLMVAAKIPPTDPTFDCALVTKCDAPVFTKVCV